MEKTKPNSDKLTTSQRSKPHFRWIGEQLTILAEGFGEVLSPQRLKIYVGDLCDIDQGRLATAFGRARRELDWFPKIAQLRDLAGANDADLRRMEGEAAWRFALDYERKYWYGDLGLLPRLIHGERHYPPPLPEKIAFAVRCVGGLAALATMTEKTRPFVKREFLLAYDQADMGVVTMSQLLEKWSAEQLALQAGEPLSLPAGEEDDASEDEGPVQ